ncbi:hypothetical protein CNECB9_4140035 [Cupriavidus necator]|uniref:Uncharacterized protein n=2 Tax=Cupriavidus necator TaxID=106590 RepID=A0A1K0JS86_CUPNE|nr:hypothetical protein CNECB9_4140035 [Cupriavidus necator]
MTGYVNSGCWSPVARWGQGAPFGGLGIDQLIWATHSSLTPLPLAGGRFLASVAKVLRDIQPPAACAQA